MRRGINPSTKVTAMRLSPSGRFLACAFCHEPDQGKSTKQTGAILFDASSGQRLATLTTLEVFYTGPYSETAPIRVISAVVLSTSERIDEKTLGSSARHPHERAGEISKICFSADERYLALGGVGHLKFYRVHVWDIERRAQKAIVLHNEDDAPSGLTWPDVTALEFSPTNPNLLVVGGLRRRGMVWDMNRGAPRCIAKFETPASIISAATFIPDDDRTVLVATRDGTVHTIPLVDNGQAMAKQQRSIDMHVDWMRVSTDRRSVVAGAPDGRFVEFEINSNSAPTIRSSHVIRSADGPYEQLDSEVCHASLSPSGRLLATLAPDSTLFLREVGQKRDILTLANLGSLFHVAPVFPPDSNDFFFAVARCTNPDEDPDSKEVSNRYCIRKFNLEGAPLSEMDCSPDFDVRCTDCHDGHVPADADSPNCPVCGHLYPRPQASDRPALLVEWYDPGLEPRSFIAQQGVAYNAPGGAFLLLVVFNFCLVSSVSIHTRYVVLCRREETAY